MKQVVIVEDDKDIAELVSLHLEDFQCETRHFANGLEAFTYLSAGDKADLIVLDVNLPGMNGLEICRKLRGLGSHVPILMLTARSEEIDKVLGLETGADDYLTKPFSVRELAARVKALLRRVEFDTKSEANPKIISYKGLQIDIGKRKVSLEGERMELTPKEFDLLTLLISNPGVTFDRKELLDKVWSHDYEGYEHTVNSHINRLRAKIEKDPNNPVYVLTSWGVGYRFNDAD